MRNSAHQTRANRTITIDFHNEATYFRLLNDGKAFVECVLAFVLALGFQLTHTATCRGGPAPAALASRRCAWGLEPHPRQALSFLARETAVHDHDHHPLSPGLLEVRRHGEFLASRGCGCRHGPDRQHPRRPRLVDVFLPPIGLWRQHGDALPSQRRRAGELPPLLLAGGISVEGKDQRADLAHPVPTSAVYTKDRDNAGHAHREQRQHVKRALAHPQRPGTGVQRGSVDVWSIPRLFLCNTRLRDCLAWLVGSRTFVAGHAAAKHTASSLTLSLLDSQHQRSRSRLFVQCP
jgi:hypothetical protein